MGFSDPLILYIARIDVISETGDQAEEPVTAWTRQLRIPEVLQGLKEMSLRVPRVFPEYGGGKERTDEICL